MTIFTLYKRQRQFRQVMTFSQGLSRGRYLRLMAVAFCDILGTIPLGTYIIVLNTSGVTPYGSWAFVHSHYSEVNPVPSVVWKNNSNSFNGLEMFRWSLVAAAFVFFALFGFADEARQHYRLVYTSLARRIGYLTSTLRGSSRVCVVHSESFDPDSLGLTFFWQYVVSLSRDEQGWHHCLSGENDWRQVPIRVERLIYRPTSYDPEIQSHFRRH